MYSKRYKYVVIDGKRVPEHRAVWEKFHGQKIPSGYVIHHVDGNDHNNDPSNLVLLTKSDHIALHHQLRREGKDPVDPTNPTVIADREVHKQEYKRNADHHRAHKKEYVANNREKVREQNRIYRETHREQRRAYSERYDAEHAEERAAYHHQRYLKKKAQITEQHRIYRETHREERAAYNKKYKQDRIELVRAKGRLYMAKKRGANPDIIAKYQAEVDRLSAMK